MAGTVFDDTKKRNGQFDDNEVGIGSIAVKHTLTNISIGCRQGNIKSISTGAHSKQETATCAKIADVTGHGQFHLRYLFKAKLAGHLLLPFHIIIIPLCKTESTVKLTVLTCKILMVQVQPIIFRQVAF